MKYRNVSIYPKVLEKRTKFSAEEKAELTQKGKRWYLNMVIYEVALGKNDIILLMI